MVLTSNRHSSRRTDPALPTDPLDMHESAVGITQTTRHHCPSSSFAGKRSRLKTGEVTVGRGLLDREVRTGHARRDQ